MIHSEIVGFLRGVADLIRDTFKRGNCQDIILPLAVLRRLDFVLADSKGKVLEHQGQLKGEGLEDLEAQLRRASGFVDYNTSRWDFEKLLADAPHFAANLRNSIAGFTADCARCSIGSTSTTPSAGSTKRVLTSMCWSASRTSISARTRATTRIWGRSSRN